MILKWEVAKLVGSGGNPAIAQGCGTDESNIGEAWRWLRKCFNIRKSRFYQ